ncbi:unnamed protein product [Cylindrotheca closterium]|uniref:Uncharacterized protein n=1 Tax=Cylindrotheca closterium TaxID=2856 RepID=A0AAD2GAI6_9STRA|nr:unnamed protein product [Cylindrotheca closterium]
MKTRLLQAKILGSLLHFSRFNHLVSCFSSRHFNHNIVLHRRSATGTSIFVKADQDSFEVEEQIGNGFISEIFQVFIEDTDAYGIMYNGNYLKFYDRALYSSPEAHSVLSPRKEWSIISLEDQKFIGSPSLGSQFVIQGTLKQAPSDDASTWDLKMTSPDGSQTFNSVSNLSVATPAESTGTSYFNFVQLQEVPAFEIKGTKGATNSFIIFRDELDTQLMSQLPLRIVLNLFERARSNLLGGPDELKRLKEDHDIVVVVTKISDCSLVDEGYILSPGHTVQVDTQSVIKRKGMIIDCFQTLKSSCGKRLAQGKITLMMISKTTERPTSKLPEWVMEKLTGETISQQTS